MLIFVLSFFSCEFSENLYINDDGSGKMEFSFDGSAIMELSDKETKSESEEKIDSTIAFKELLEEKKDSISKLSKEEQENLKALERFNLRMLVDPEINQMLFNINTEFKSVDELTNMMEAMNRISKFSDEDPIEGADKNTPMDALANGEFSELKFTLNNNVFKRTTVITDQDGYTNALNNLGDMESMYAESNYTLNYYFPKKIKSISNSNAVLSKDKKSFSLTFEFVDYIKDPEAMNLEVILEQK